MKRIIISLLAFCLTGIIQAQEIRDSSYPIIFIYDASGSMWGQMDGKTKKEIAAEVLTQSVNNLPEQQKVGLVAYGHRQKGDCKDVEFLVNMDNTDKSAVTGSLQSINPLGKTPLAFSALQVIDKLRSSGNKATIILVTDGIESCGGNICEVIKQAREEGIDFRLHIIGFGLKADETEQLKCAAEAGGGQYYDAADAGGLGEVLNEATATTVVELEKNISLYAVKNGEAVDVWVKVLKDGKDTRLRGARTYKDTAFFHLPEGQFELKVVPLEGSDVDAIILSDVSTRPDTLVHRTVSFDAGKFAVTTMNNQEGWDSVVKIYPQSGKKPVASGRTYGRTDYYELNPGIYEVEVQAMKIDGTRTSHRFTDVQVQPNDTVEVRHVYQSGIAMIGAMSGSERVDAVVKVIDPESGKVVSSSRTYTSENNNPRKFLLNPGSYEVTLATLGKHKGKNEKVRIVVEAGKTVERVVRF